MKHLLSGWIALMGTLAAADGPARATLWTQGQKISWGQRAAYCEIFKTEMIHPAGDEAEPPESYLAVSVRAPTGETKTFGVTVAQALRRGFSLRDLRTHLSQDGYRSTIALKLDEAGRLIDFVMRDECELSLMRRAELAQLSPR